MKTQSLILFILFLLFTHVTNAANSYVVVSAKAGVGGTIYPKGNVKILKGGAKTFSIKPQNALVYEILDVKVDGISKKAISEYTFSNVTSKHTITAKFQKKPYTINIINNDVSNGSLTPNRSLATVYNNKITFTATPKNGFKATIKVDGVAVSLGLINKPIKYKLVVAANHTVTASFDNGTTTTPSVTMSDFSWVKVTKLNADFHSAYTPSIAIDEQGNAVSVWIENTTPTSVYASYSTANSGIWQEAIKINGANGNIPETIGEYHKQPNVAVANGIGVAVWTQSDGKNSSVYANRLEKGIWATAQLLELENDGDANNARVVIDKSGNATVVWIQNRSSKSQTPAILSSRYSISTKSWSDPVSVSTLGVDKLNVGAIQLKLTPEGQPAVLWLGTSIDDKASKLYYSVGNSSGWNNAELITEGEINATSFTFATDDQQPVVTWTGEHHIKMARRSVSTWIISNITAEFDSISLASDIASTPEGGLIVAWCQDTYSYNQQLFYKLFVKHYSTSSGWKNPIQIADLGCQLPRLATDKYGRAVLLWGGPHTQESHLIAGKTWSSPYSLASYNKSLQHTVSMNSSGRVAAIWTNSAFTPSSIEAILSK